MAALAVTSSHPPGVMENTWDFLSHKIKDVKTKTVNEFIGAVTINSGYLLYIQGMNNFSHLYDMIIDRHQGLFHKL